MTATRHPIAQLLHRHAPDTPVAVSHRDKGTDTGTKTAADLRRDVAIAASHLPPATDGSHIALVFGDDRYHFTVALLATWARGHRAALPPNNRRDTVKGLIDRPDVVDTFHDLTAGIGLRVPEILAAGSPGPMGEPVFPLDFAANGHAATLFTSGSTGQTQPWPKTFGQLLGEVATLADSFPSPDGTVTVATVPPAHLYGLLFSVLLPLATGGAFLRTAPFAPEAVAAAVRATGASILVSVPAHLRACTTVAAGSLEPLTRIFSSTAPLPAKVAISLSGAHVVPITEIFGSTETGGIATRQQSDGLDWQPLPGVSIALGPAPDSAPSQGTAASIPETAEPGRLLVDSPWLHPSSERPYGSGDLAVLTEGPTGPRFQHRGRADDVVKVGGRRVSLRAMERTLLALEGVEDAVVAAIPDDGGRGSRIIAAICGPDVKVDSDANQSTVARTALLAHFDASCVPRNIKVFERLPRENNGKLVRSALLRAFGLTPLGAPVVHTLQWGPAQTVPATATATAADAATKPPAPVWTRVRFASVLPKNYVMFEGHFPGYPVLAGAVQLSELVLPCIEKVLPDAGRLAEMKGLKFTKRLAPGDAFEVEVAWQAEAPERVDFTIRKGDLSCSAGKLRFVHD